MERIPLSAVVHECGSAVRLALENTGYKEVAISLTVQNMEEDGSNEYDICNSSNLKPSGVKVLLENVLEKMNEDGVVETITGAKND